MYLAEEDGLERPLLAPFHHRASRGPYPFQDVAGLPLINLNLEGLALHVRYDRLVALGEHEVGQVHRHLTVPKDWPRQLNVLLAVGYR